MLAPLCDPPSSSRLRDTPDMDSSVSENCWSPVDIWLPWTLDSNLQGRQMLVLTVQMQHCVVHGSMIVRLHASYLNSLLLFMLWIVYPENKDGRHGAGCEPSISRDLQGLSSFVVLSIAQHEPCLAIVTDPLVHHVAFTLQ